MRHFLAGDSVLGRSGERNESERTGRVHEQNEVCDESGVRRLSGLSDHGMGEALREGAAA